MYNHSIHSQSEAGENCSLIDGINILLVGTSPELDELAESLSEEGEHISVNANIKTESTIAGATTLFEEERIDYVVSEYELEDGTGLDLLSWVRNEYGEVPFLMWTGSGSEEIASKAIEHGVTEYVPKDLDASTYTSIQERIFDGLKPVAEQFEDGRLDDNEKRVYADFLHEHVWDIEKVGIFEVDLNTWSLSLYEGLAETDDLCYFRDQTLDTLAEFVHPDDRDGLKEVMMDMNPDSDPRFVNFRVLDQASASYYIRTYLVPMEHPDGEGTLVRGIGWDSTEKVVREESLAAVSKVSRAASQSDTIGEVAHIVADAGSDVFELIGPFVYLYDDETGELYPAAYSQRTGKSKPPKFEAGENPLWQAFKDLESKSVDSTNQKAEIEFFTSNVRETLIYPIDGYGVIVAGFADSHDLDGAGEEAIEILSSTAKTAMDQVNQIQEIREREERSKKQKKKYGRLNELNKQIRTVNQTVMDADSHSDINQSVCDSLVEIEQFDFAWIAEPDYAENQLDPQAKSHPVNSYIDEIAFDIDSENSPPAVSVVEQREPVVDKNIARGVQNSEWKNQALLNGYRSILSVPLLYDSVLHGVLTVYSKKVGGVEDMTLDTLSELGELIGFAHQTLSQRDALVSDDNVDVSLTIDDEEESFIQLASEVGSKIEIQHITHRSDETYLVYVAFQGRISVEDTAAVLEEFPLVDDSRLISESDTIIFELVAHRDSSLFDLTDLGAELVRAEATSNNLSLVVAIPRDEGVQSFIDRVRNRYPSVSLHSQQRPKAEEESDLGGKGSPFELLTDRQREILDIAYYSGYFNYPRDSSATEVAESIGISQPGFSKQCQTAVGHLLSIIYE
jgi:DNA-binding response OmpR family regulator